MSKTGNNPKKLKNKIKENREKYREKLKKTGQELELEKNGHKN